MPVVFSPTNRAASAPPAARERRWSERILTRIKHGKGRLKDLSILLEIAGEIGIIPGTTICGLADGAAWPIKNAINKFRDEFEGYIKRTNPTGHMQEEPAESLRLVELAH